MYRYTTSLKIESAVGASFAMAPAPLLRQSSRHRLPKDALASLSRHIVCGASVGALVHLLLRFFAHRSSRKVRLVAQAPTGFVLRVWPLGARSAPIWAAVCSTIASYFHQTFLSSPHPMLTGARSILKRDQYRNLMQIMVRNVMRKEGKNGMRSEGQMVSGGDGAEEVQELEKSPEASRVFELLWDDVYEVRTTRYGLDPKGEHVQYLEELLKRRLKEELQCHIVAVRHNAQESENASVTPAATNDLAKTLGLAEEVARRLGKEFVCAQQLCEAKVLLAGVGRAKGGSWGLLLQLLKPALPSVAVALPSQVIAVALQSFYCQNRTWELIADYVATGNDRKAFQQSLSVLFGHLCMWFFEIVKDVWNNRAGQDMGRYVKTSVMRALMSQDFEFFDKNSAETLLDRLHRDSGVFTHAAIALPQELLGNVAKILVSLSQIYFTAPTDMFFWGTAPLPIVGLVFFYISAWSAKLAKQKKKLGDEVLKSTSEVLRNIKTVRQYANESREVDRFSESLDVENSMSEKSEICKKVVEKLTGVVIVAGLLYSMRVGQPHVRAGRLPASALWDISIKCMFWVGIPMKDLFEMGPRIIEALEPFKRIAAILESTTNIEPRDELRDVLVDSKEAMRAILDRCLTIPGKSGAEHISLRTDWNPDDHGSPLRAGCALMGTSLSSQRVTSRDRILMQDSTFPLTLSFSRRLRPAYFEGRIEFEDVHFSYPSDLRTPVLMGLSFTVESGQKVALVGEAGCGKSTVFSLLQRLYEPTSGTIRVDGIPIQQYDVDFLRSRFVLVDQKPVLFSGSVRDNVTYGVGDRRVEDEEVIQALREASMWEGANSVSAMPDNIFTKIGTGGINLSGGQSQRVSIARAMIRNPDAIMLDEATSALDNKNEREVQESLDRLARKGSALVIAHRLTTIMDSDKIIVMSKGRVAEQGTHEELLHCDTALDVQNQMYSGIYRHLWHLMFQSGRDAKLSDEEADQKESNLARELESLCRNAKKDSELSKLLEEDRALLERLQDLVAGVTARRGATGSNVVTHDPGSSCSSTLSDSCATSPNLPSRSPDLGAVAF